jgi:hypothetical protein
MHKIHEQRLRPSRVTAVFEDRALSFNLAKGATLEELSAALPISVGTTDARSQSPSNLAPSNSVHRRARRALTGAVGQVPVKRLGTWYSGGRVEMRSTIRRELREVASLSLLGVVVVVATAAALPVLLQGTCSRPRLERTAQR